MPFSQADYLAMQARLAPKQTPNVPQDAVIDESSLHEKILSECRVRGWYAVHSRMDRRTTNNVGLCDLIIFADGGKVYLVELKTKSGKLTSEQNIFIAWLAKLGQTTHVVRSFSEFLEIVK